MATTKKGKFITRALCVGIIFIMILSVTSALFEAESFASENEESENTSLTNTSENPLKVYISENFKSVEKRAHLEQILIPYTVSSIFEYTDIYVELLEIEGNLIIDSLDLFENGFEIGLSASWVSVPFGMNWDNFKTGFIEFLFSNYFDLYTTLGYEILLQEYNIILYDEDYISETQYLENKEALINMPYKIVFDDPVQTLAEFKQPIIAEQSVFNRESGTSFNIFSEYKYAYEIKNI